MKLAFLYNIFSKFVSLNWLTGPFLVKELRVSSRHRRNYLLRTFYIAGLLIFIAVIWLNVVVEYSGSITYQKSRMAQAGKTITMMIVWFQFIVTQVVAVIIFCNSINSEIYHRTLGVLLTSPVNSFQIIAGKLISKLLELYHIRSLHNSGHGCFRWFA